MSGMGRSRKRKLAAIMDPAFLRALIVPDRATDGVPMLQLTNGALQALHDCQESFIQELTRELKTLRRGKSELDENQTQTVNPCHVEAAMRAMGLDDVLEQAKLYLNHKQEQEHQGEQQQGVDDNTTGQTAKKKKSRKKPTKSKQPFTEEMQAEQERLLQASIRKGGKDP
jgi:hypothetical protein